MELKKDWLYNYKVLVFGAIAIGFILGIVFSIATIFNNKDSMRFMQSLYEPFYRTSITYSVLYFSFCFLAISPQFANNKTYLSTTNLPFSKKQLFFKGLKPFLIIFPVYFLFGAFINTFLIQRGHTYVYEGYSFAMIFIENLSSSLVFSSYMFIISLQMTSAIIFSLSKNIKWYITVPCMILFNGILIGSLIVGNVIFKFNLGSNFISNRELSITFSWLNGNTIIFFMASLILFLLAFRNIEKIHR